MLLDSIRPWLTIYDFYTVHLRSAEAALRRQEAGLRKLIMHAYRAVPLWKEILDETGLSPESIAIKDLHKLPVTGKSTYIGRFPEEYTDVTRPIRKQWHSTSGSTGTPFTFLGRYNSARFDDFMRLRFLLWKKGRPMDLAHVRAARIKMTPETRNNRLFLPLGSYREKPDEAIRALAAFGPTVLESYATVLLDVARRASADLSASLTIPYVTSYGEKLTDSARSFIAKAFNAEVYDRYGMEEIGVLSMECSKHNGQHIYMESAILEIVDDAGMPLPAGEHGHILVTDLLNYNMPFIRYDTGDRGYISLDQCPCGLRTPRLWFDGRYSASLSFNGTTYHHLEFDDILNTLMNSVLQYQIVKLDENTVSVRLVTGSAFSDETGRDIALRMQGLLGENILVSVERCDALQSMPRGKSKTLIDESADAS